MLKIPRDGEFVSLTNELQCLHPISLASGLFNIPSGIMPFEQNFKSFLKCLAGFAGLVLVPLFLYLCQDRVGNALKSCTGLLGEGWLIRKHDRVSNSNQPGPGGDAANADVEVTEHEPVGGEGFCSVRTLSDAAAIANPVQEPSASSSFGQRQAKVLSWMGRMLEIREDVEKGDVSEC